MDWRKIKRTYIFLQYKILHVQTTLLVFITQIRYRNLCTTLYE